MWGHMSKILLGVVGAISIAAGSAALAADMHVKALKAPPPAVFNWTGFYIGANAGIAFNNSSYEQDPAGCFVTGCGFGGVAANPQRRTQSHRGRHRQTLGHNPRPAGNCRNGAGL